MSWIEHTARNNAEWCDVFCRTHGIAGDFNDHMWACRSRTPPLYPDAVTLDAAATAAGVLEHVDTSTPGCSIKDSFRSLELRDAGFRVLFDATWIACTTTTAGEPVPDAWSRVTDTNGLDQWRRASGRDLGDALLDSDDIVILAERASDDVVAGAVLNRSEAVVGISNVFALGRELDGVWSTCLAFAGNHFADVPVVGYEAGAPLVAACRHGFEAVGELRVWIDDRVR